MFIFVFQNAFKRLNHALNDFFSNVKRRNHENSNEFLNPLGTQPLDYQHFIDIDKFYDGNIRRTEAGDRKRPNFVPKVIRKTAVGALDIVLPTSMFDVRVNCKLEDPVSMQSGAYCRKIRKKDRISYRFNIWSVDLTKVDEFDEVENDQPIGHPCKTTFEFEMELLDMSSLRKAIATNDKAWTYEAANCLLTSLRQLSLLANPQVSLPSCCKVPLKRSAERHIQEDKSARQKSS